MTEKELKKLNRYQLLELIIIQTEQIQALQEQLKQTQEQLEARQIRIRQAGSIAEAALQLSGIFETAQTAADLYLSNAQTLQEEAAANAREIIAQAEQQAERILQHARETITAPPQAAPAETENP